MGVRNSAFGLQKKENIASAVNANRQETPLSSESWIRVLMPRDKRFECFPE